MRHFEKFLPSPVRVLAASTVLSPVGCTVAPQVSNEQSPSPVSASATASLKPVNNSANVVNRCNRDADAKVLVTFDDSGTPAQIDAILSELKKNNMKAAFFPLGNWAEKNLDQIDEIKAAGHIMGNHSQTHQRLGELAATDEAKFTSPTCLATAVAFDGWVLT